MLSCHEIREKSSDYLDGTASWLTRWQFKLHLAMCKACAAYVRQMKATITLLQSMGKTADPVDVDAVVARVKERNNT